MEILSHIAVLLVSIVATGAQLYPKWPKQPTWTEKPLVARYLMHYAEWGTVSGISPEHGFVPYGTLQSFADGPLEKSTGTPYFYIAEISDTYINMNYNNTMSLSLSLAESDLCKSNNLDPMDPPCSRVTVVGKMVPVEDEEKEFAKSSLFGRHPTMKSWPSGHGWRFYKLKLTGIYLIDYYGGYADIKLDDYFKANPVIKGVKHSGFNRQKSGDRMMKVDQL